jgi:hypothetical protein
MNPMWRGLGPGLLYGVLAFLCGAVLGPIRELLLAPRIGGLPAALVEAVVMVIALYLAARVAGRGLPPGLPWLATAGMALAGLFLVLLADAVLAASLEATGLAATRASRGMAEQAVGLLLLLWLVAAPFLAVGRDGTARTGNGT